MNVEAIAGQAPTIVREAREDVGLTQRALAHAVGMQQSNIAAIEAGTRPVSAALLKTILLAADYRPSIALERFARELTALGARLGVSNIRVFGSVARGEDHSDSDVDLLIDVDPGNPFYNVGTFAADAEQLLGFPVDVVIDRGDRRGMDHIRATAVPL